MKFHFLMEKLNKLRYGMHTHAFLEINGYDTWST